MSEGKPENNEVPREDVPYILPGESEYAAAARREKAKTPEQRGKDVAYAIEATAVCLATDFIDPLIGAPIQDWMEHRQHRKTAEILREHGCTPPPHLHDEHHHSILEAFKQLFKGNMKGFLRASGGELIGDLLAIPALIGTQRYLPRFTHWVNKSLGAMADPFYERLGRRAIKNWALKEGVDPGDAAYDTKLAEWKTRQTDHLAQTAIISAAAVALNVPTQKLIGKYITHEKTNTFHILVGKVVGQIVTALSLIGLRLLAPDAVEKFEKKISHKFATPAVKAWDRLMGRKSSTEKDAHESVREKEMPAAEPAVKSDAAETRTQAPSFTARLHSGALAEGAMTR